MVVGQDQTVLADHHAAARTLISETSTKSAKETKKSAKNASDSSKANRRKKKSVDEKKTEAITEKAEDEDQKEEAAPARLESSAEEKVERENEAPVMEQGEQKVSEKLQNADTEVDTDHKSEDTPVDAPANDVSSDTILQDVASFDDDMGPPRAPAPSAAHQEHSPAADDITDHPALTSHEQKADDVTSFGDLEEAEAIKILQGSDARDATSRRERASMEEDSDFASVLRDVKSTCVDATRAPQSQQDINVDDIFPSQFRPHATPEAVGADRSVFASGERRDFVSPPVATSTAFAPHSSASQAPPAFGLDSIASLPPFSTHLSPFVPPLPPVTSSSAVSSTALPTTSTASAFPAPPRDLFPSYFQDPSLPLPPPPQQPDARLGLAPAQSSLEALQRSSSDFLQRASASTLPGYSESLARLGQAASSGSASWMEDRSRSWAPPPPSTLIPDLDPIARSAFPLDSAAKRGDAGFGSAAVAPAATDRFDVPPYMSGSHLNVSSSNFSKSLPPSVNPPKHLEDAYRQSIAAADYRALTHAPMGDMYSRMGMNPTLALDKYYPYPRPTDAMYRSAQLGANPFIAPTTAASQFPYDRDFPRNPYAQDPTYSKYLPGGNLGQPLTPSGDYFGGRGVPPEPFISDPYRRSMVHNVFPRYF